MKIDLNTYQKNSNFYGKIDLLLTVKSFNLQEIRARYLASKKAGKKIGSFKRRKVALGGIVSIQLENGQIIQEQVLSKLKEPRGIAQHKDKLAISSENTIYCIGEKSNQLNDDWFSYIHTVDFDESGTKLLVSSSGLDIVLEYDIKTGNKLFEWLAWENGFNTVVHPESQEKFILTRDVKFKGHKNYKVIDHPKVDTLPTAMRAAFINSVHYDKIQSNKILATFFHEGKLFQIDRTNGKAERLISDLESPHGGRNFKDGYLVTNTRGGEVVIKSKEKEFRYVFHNLPGKPNELCDEEWLQNSIALDENIVTIDSNRTAFVIFNLSKELIDIIPFNNNWAVQDMVSYPIDKLKSKLIQEIG